MELKKVVSFDYGEVFFSEEKGMYNVYTRAVDHGNLVFQFGVYVKDCSDIRKLIWDNLYHENLYFEID